MFVKLFLKELLIVVCLFKLLFKPFKLGGEVHKLAHGHKHGGGVGNNANRSLAFKAIAYFHIRRIG